MRTIFNFLGPLTNPAGARRQLIGVSDPAYLERMAGALARLGVDRALVVSSEDGLDEMSTSAPTHVVEVNGDAIERYVVAPQDVGIEPSAPDAVAGGTPERQRGDHARDPRRRARPGARPRAAQRRRRDLRRRAWPTACARASRPLARRSTRAPPRARTDAYLELSRRLAAAMSVLDRIVDATRADVARRRQAVPLAELEQRAAGTPRGPPVLRGAARCRASRSSPSTSAARPARARSAATRRWSRSSAPTSAAARRRCRSSPRSATSAARWTTCARRARPARCRSCARTSSSTPTRSTSRRWPAPTRSCSSSRRSTTTTSSLLHREARRARPRRPRRGPRRGGARAGAGGRRRRRHRHQQPRPRRLHGRRRAHLRAAQRRPGGQDGRLGVGLPQPRAARRPRARGGRRGPHRRGADARAGRRGRLPGARPASRAASPRPL